MRSKKTKLTFCICVIVLTIILILYSLWANTALQITEYNVTDPLLPEAFDGYRIVQVSDLHCTEFGADNSKLIDAIAESCPDIIVITGDFLDTRYGTEEICISFAGSAANIAPTYYISGNHDPYTDDYTAFTAKLENAGVTVLENETVTLYSGNSSIALIGIDDPILLKKNTSGVNSSSRISQALDTLSGSTEGYTVLLAHHPEFVNVYAEYGISLVFSGHAHGGQFRFPVVGGLYAPGQGVLPEYDSGVYSVGGTKMIVSRGLGNSGFPLRLNNRPELVITELHTGDASSK